MVRGCNSLPGAALLVLRLHQDLSDAEILVAGAATREFLDQYDVGPGRVESLPRAGSDH